MKSESAIRKHRDVLLAISGQGCTESHETLIEKLECQAAAALAKRHAALLSWVLDENPSYDRLEESLVAMVARSKG